MWGAGIDTGPRRSQPDRPVLPERPARVVGDLPGMAVGVDEDPGVAPPERRPGGAPDPRTRGRRLCHRAVHVGGRGEVSGPGPAPPPTPRLNGPRLAPL